MFPNLQWSLNKRSDPILVFRLEIYPEAKPKNKYYAVATKYFNLELGIGYRTFWIWYNR